MPFTLVVKSDDVHVRLGGDDALWTVLNEPSFRNGLLGGRFVGTIPTDHARLHPHDVAMSLWLGEGKLRGWAAAQATTEPIAGAVSSYVELRKNRDRRSGVTPTADCAPDPLSSPVTPVQRTPRGPSPPASR